MPTNPHVPMPENERALFTAYAETLQQTAEFIWKELDKDHLDCAIVGLITAWIWSDEFFDWLQTHHPALFAEAVEDMATEVALRIEAQQRRN